ANGSGASSGYGGGQSSGGGAGYGNTGAGYDQTAPANSYTAQAAAYFGVELSSALAALGIFKNNRQTDWPLAFRLIPPGENRNAMARTESVLQVALMQGANGQAAAAILKEATRDVHRLRLWLREHHVGMAEATYDAGSAFLRRIEGALK